MGKERRVFERESVNLSFIFSVDEGKALTEGDWYEASTVDIGPVLVGGMAFQTDMLMEVGSHIRVALFMDLELKKAWENEPEGFPIYKGTVCRVIPNKYGNHVAITFKGFEGNPEDLPS